MNKNFLFLFSSVAITLFLLSVLFLPSSALAVVTIQGMVNAVVMTTLYIASGIVVILWIITGLLFLLAQGDPGKLGSAKKALLSAVAGTLLVIVASSAIYLVGSAFGL